MAAFWTVILKNNSGSIVPLEDFGLEIANGSDLTLSDYFDYSDIADSKELDGLVDDGTLVINDGTVDLSAADGVNYIKRDNIKNDLDTHYTKTELNTANGGSVVDWSNIINAPSFGSPVWIEPVLYMVEVIDSTAPASPNTGDVFVDTGDQHYYKYDGTSWVDIGSASLDDKVIDRSVNPEVVTVFDGTSTWVGAPEESDNSAVMVNDDGDNKNAQYVYSTETGTWIKIADVDFEDHLNGDAGKHDASEIDVEGTYSNLPNAPSDLETIIGDINTQMTEALDNNTLTGAYNQGGAGAGRVIDAITGPVEFDSGTAAGASFRIVPKSSLPTTNPDDGQFAVIGGIMYIYDATRSKWLSVQRQFLTFGRRGNTRNQYINFAVGTLASNNSGYRIPRASVVVSMTGQIDSSDTCDLHLRKNDTAANIATLSISTATGASDISTNLSLNANDFLQSFCSVAVGNVQDPVFIVEIAYTI